MKNFRFWRTALAVTLVLTVMLSITGGTIAWFTDSVESVDNIIMSGKLDVGLLYSEDGENWTDVENENAEPMFDYQLWEPGYTEYKQLQIVNKGTLAFKYALHIVPTGEIGKLAEVIDVYYSDAEPARGSLGTFAGTLKALAAGKPLKAIGTLEAGDAAEKLYITLHMKEEAGNEYQNLPLGVFDIQILATQATVESDSFDHMYDEGAGKEVNAESFIDAINNLKDGDVLVLGPGVYEWTPGAALMVRSNNVTIKGAGPETVIKVNEAFFVYGDNVTISDLTIDSSAADGNIAALKATYENVKPEQPVKNLTVRNVVLRSDKSHGLNLHYVDGAVVDNVSVEEYDKCGFSLAEARNVVFTNCKTVSGGWGGDIGGMYKSDYAYANEFSFDNTNVFGNGRVYSENVNDEVVYPEKNWDKQQSAAGWVLTRNNFGVISNASDLSAQLAKAQSGDVLEVKADIEVNQPLVIGEGVKLVSVSGSTLKIAAGTSDAEGTDSKIKLSPNASLEGLKISTEAIETVNAVYMMDGSSVIGCEFVGQYVPGENETSRGIVVAPGAKNVLISGSTFTNLRQPAYINIDCSGEVKNNTVSGTRGFVAVCNSEITFTGNKFSNNAVDICIIAEDAAENKYQGQAAAISSSNNGAVVENQVSGEKAQNGALISNP